MSDSREDDLPGHAFICYVRDDGERVDRLQGILERAGIKVWRDTAKIWPGQDWKLEIRDAISTGSLAFVACFSENSERRGSSYQNEELVLAVEQMRLRPPGLSWLIPVRFAECSIPDFDLGAGRTLDSLQHVDLFGEAWEHGTARLIGALHRVFESSLAPGTASSLVASAVESSSGAPVAVGDQDARARVAQHDEEYLQVNETLPAGVRDARKLRPDDDFLRRYLLHVVQEHGVLEPPDFDRRRRVPIDQLYVSPVLYKVPAGQHGQPEHPVELRELAERINRMVLLGNPGAGKTSAALALMHMAAREEMGRVPFLVTVRDFAADGLPRLSVARYLERRLDTFYQCPPPAGLIGMLLRTGHALVIFDGLDELLDPSARAEVAARIERFATEYPLAGILVTSRLVGYDQARLDDRQFVAYRIGEFTEPQAAAYARNWFAQEPGIEHEADTWARAFMRESAAIPDLRSSPLLLALMCILYRGEGSLPRNRAEVYQQCASLLFRQWDARRRIHPGLRAGHLLEPLLRDLAWQMLTGQPIATEAELIRQTTAFLHGRGFESEAEAENAASEFIAFCRGRMWVFSEAGVTATGIRLYSFTHRTFLEYFAAAHLACTCDSPERLARVLGPRIARNQWDVIGELATQIKDRTSSDGADRILQAMLASGSRRAPAGRSRTLQFLGRCLRSADPSPRTVRELTRQVLAFLCDGDLDDADRGLPLAWLIASCAASRNVVSDELSAYLAAVVRSDDPATSLDGLRIGAWLLVGVSGNWAGRGPTVTSDSPIVRFWSGWRREFMIKHSAEITSAAVQDVGLRDRALESGLMTIDDALHEPGGLAALLTTAPIGIFNGHETPFLLKAAYALLRYCTDDHPEPGLPGDHFAGLGRYLAKRPRLPWTDTPPRPWDTFFDDCATPRTANVRLDPFTFAGAASTVLMAAEGEPLLATSAPKELGPLSDLCPYISLRWNTAREADPLPPLPVPVSFQNIFTDWAGNKLSLAAN